MDEIPKRPKIFRWIYGKLPLLICVLLVLTIVIFDGQIKDAQDKQLAEKKAVAKKERPPVNVVIQQIKPGPVRERINLPGFIEPWTDLELLAEVRGSVISVNVEEGEHVQQGDVIVELDARDYENTINSVKASFDLSVVTKKRLQRLYDQNIISKAELDDADAKVKSLAAELDIAALQRERCKIISPISGVVNKLIAKEGLLLSVADPVAVILKINQVKVVVGIPESDVGAVRKLENIEFEVDALGKKKFQGRKHFFAVAPDSMAQLYRLELKVDNSALELLPGMFARVKVIKQEFLEALTIPLYSVISRKDRRFVYVDNNGKAEVKEIDLGILDGWKVQVVSGLEPGDRVIVVGQRNVDSDQDLNIIRTVDNPEDIKQ